MKICPKCNAEHERPGTFCSRTCANSHIVTEEHKLKTSNSLKGRRVGGRPSKTISPKLNTVSHEKTSKICVVCGIEHSKAGKTCSKHCMGLLISSKCKGKTGGYRPGSGRAKTGYYKGIYCGSTYELAWVIYQIDHGNKFERFLGCLEYNGKKYFPDFLQNGKIVEIKGYENEESVAKKTEIANQNGFQVKVLRFESLTEEFSWVKNNYQYKKLQELYDDHKPKFTYCCSCCKKDFNREHIIRTDIKYCSRTCAGRGHVGRNENGYNQYSVRQEVRSVAFQAT